MQEVQLYIDGQRVELFKDETISLTQTIQNVKDISKVFTDFSKTFNVPASRDNNKIFKHYYNFDIVEGFDARYKVDALIKLNGVDFRKGKLRLNSVSMKNNKANSYKLVFFGETVSLSDLLGDDELITLSDTLSDFNSTLSAANTLQGLKNGWDLVGSTLTAKSDLDPRPGDLIYPFISPKTRYVYNSTSPQVNYGDEANNLHVVTPTSYSTDLGLKWQDLKPAIKVRYILEAIETRYGLTFSDDFFVYTNKDFEDLYLWLHKEKGDISDQVDISTKKIKLEEWAYSSGDGEVRSDSNTSFVTSYTYESNVYILMYLTINVTGTGLYNVDFVNNNDESEVYYSYKNITGNQLKLFGMLQVEKNNPDKTWYPKIVVSTNGGITDFDVSLEVKHQTSYFDSRPTVLLTSNYTYNSGGSVSLSSGMDIGRNMPKMKIIDFLTSLFKMFNLTAYVEDNIIVVQPLDEYYDSGIERDITKYIDISSSEIDRNKIYSSIDFTYAEPKTFQTINTNAINGTEYGNLTYKSDDDNYDGGKYEVKVGFEKVSFERLNDEKDATQTRIGYGYFVDKDQNPVVGSPLLFYVHKYDGAPMYFDDGSSYTYLEKYNRPTNHLNYYGGATSIDFGLEQDVFSGGTVSNSLYSNYYNNYISSVFNSKSRIIKTKAILPLSFLLNYTLADILIIDGKKYRINSINSNLQTGESKLELINIV